METEDTFEIVEDIEEDNRINQLEEKLQITEKKLNELKSNLEKRVIERTVEINKLLKDKSRFIDNLSHDLATPITPLITLLPILKDELTKPESKELLETCIRNVEYIKRVINNARELSDIGSSDLLLKKENLLDIINILKNKYEVVFKTYNIKVQNKVSSDVFVKTEKNRLIQLFDHITSNAIYSMPNGGILTFESKPVNKQEGLFIQISVKDTGVGLTRDQTDRIFDEFYKTDDSRHKLDSTGLGLTICKKIIEKHGGKIWADSHGHGTGTSIFFMIPSPEVVYSRSF